MLAVLRIIKIVTQQILGYRQLLNMDTDLSNLTAQIVPEVSYTFRVYNGDVQNAMNLLSHGAENKGCPSGLGPQEVCERRMLFHVLLHAEAGSFHKIKYGNRHILEFLACLSRNLEIPAFKIRFLV